ncbi:hypothetical protein GGR56DRAFT_216307 [Xylariaceae sp. FL0804]|nr:hypothetical protein GGR56DRAFT_216307 [Xylariaceae sp. FL0804]
MSELLAYLVENDPSFRKARLPALYSDFRPQRTLNPDGFAANVAAWKRGLARAAFAGQAPSRSAAPSRLVLELDDSLLRALESKQFGRPLALGAVLQEALAAGEVMPLKQFLGAPHSIYYKSWGSMPAAVLGWALRQAGLLGGPGDAMPKGQFVVLQNLEAATKAFSDAAAERVSPFERTFSKAHFQRTFEGSIVDGQRLSETDLEVLVTYLSRDKGILATDGHTVKIRDAGEGAHITQEDSAIASLKELTEDLGRQVDALARRVDELQAAAQAAVRRKNTAAARGALRSRRAAESTLAARHATLGQLEDVAAKLQQAADNVALVRVMEQSGAALRSLNARVGGADAVDRLLDGLRDEMSTVDEVGGLLAEGTGAPSAGVVDDAEVDDEFEALLADERRREEAAERVRREAQEAREADETRRKLAELDRLAPVPAQAVGETDAEAEAGGEKNRPLTPVSATADELGEMHIDTDEKEEKDEDAIMTGNSPEAPARVPAQ